MTTTAGRLCSLLALLPLAGCASRQRTPPAEPDVLLPPGDGQVQVSTPDAARAKLRAISGKRVQLWVVVHVRAPKHLRPDGSIDEEALVAGAVSDVDAVVEGGGDLMMLINSSCPMPLYERVLSAVRTRHPHFPLGISALSYGPENLTEGARLAEKFGAQVTWTEVAPGTQFEFEEEDGRYVRAAPTRRALAREVMQRASGRMLVSGVHMKYTRPLDHPDFSEAMRAALGAMDGINVTGPKTAQLADLGRIRLARELSGGFPMGLASGVSAENVAEVMPFVDYLIVGTSLKDPADARRTSRERVRALRERMDSLGGGLRGP